MTTPSPTPTPLTKWKHALIIGALAAAGAFIGAIQPFIADPAGIAIFSGLAALLGEALTYEHSV